MIQCSGRGHLDVPPLIPMDATTIYLDGNNMSSLLNPGKREAERKTERGADREAEVYVYLEMK